MGVSIGWRSNRPWGGGGNIRFFPSLLAFCFLIINRPNLNKRKIRVKHRGGSGALPPPSAPPLGCVVKRSAICLPQRDSGLDACQESFNTPPLCPMTLNVHDTSCPAQARPNGLLRTCDVNFSANLNLH